MHQPSLATPKHCRSTPSNTELIQDKRPRCSTRKRKLYKTLNDYVQAEPLLLNALDIRQKKTSPAKLRNCARPRNDLGELYTATGAYDKAAPRLQTALETRKRLLNADHEKIAQTLQALANLNKQTGKAADAENLFRQAVSIYGKTVGGEHPDYANALEGLALFYSARSQYDLAEPLLARILEIREKVFGPDHHDVGVSLDALGLIKFHQRHYPEAAALYLRALVIWGGSMARKTHGFRLTLAFWRTVTRA